MNENIDLTKILKDCPTGWELYSSIYGHVTFYRIENSSEYPVKFFYINKNNSKKYGGVTEQGLYVSYFNGECTLFPSKDQRDWSKFTAPWYNKFVEPKFKVGDWIIPKNEVLQITSIEGTSYRFNNKSHYWEICCCDEQYRFWTIQDANDGDVLVNGSNIFIFHFINNRRLMGYCHVNMDNGNFYNDIGKNECFCTIDALVTPATKEQRDALMKAMNDAGYEWNAEKKELNKKKSLIQKR